LTGADGGTTFGTDLPGYAARLGRPTRRTAEETDVQRIAGQARIGWFRIGPQAWRGSPAAVMAAGFMLMSAAPAFAASQGREGAMSLGTIGISVHKPPMIAVAGSLDLIVADDRDWTAEREVCVLGRGIVGYRLSVLDSDLAGVTLDGHRADGRTLLSPDGEAGCTADNRSRLGFTGQAGAAGGVATLLIIPE